MSEKITNIIKKINEKEDWKLYETENEFIFNTLCLFLKDYYETERLNEKTEEEILQYTKTEKNEATKILNLLLERGILLKASRKTFDGATIDIYCLSYAYIKNIENMINYAVDKPKDLKIGSDIIKDFEKYQTYSDWNLKNIARVINEYFNFHTEIDNGMIDFEMGGCTYNVYLSRGYIVLEEADNSTIDNTWTVDDINEFVDLIKDLKEDN